MTASRERVGQAMLRVLNRISALMCQEERRRCILFPLFVDEYIESSKKRSSLVRAEGSMGSGNFMMSMQSGNFKTAFGSVMEDNVVPELRGDSSPFPSSSTARCSARHPPPAPPPHLLNVDSVRPTADEMVVDAGEGHGPRKELFALYGKTVYAGSGGDVRSAMQSMAAKQMMAKGWGRDPMEPIRLLEWHTGASACWFSRRTKG